MIRHHLSIPAACKNCPQVEVSSLKREKEEAESMWALRQEGLRSALAGAEERAAALAAALDARPTASQVSARISSLQLAAGGFDWRT